MTSPAQTVAGKDKSNPLIAEDLLKILRESIPLPPLIKIQLIDSHPWNDEATKRRQVNTTPLTTTSQNPQPGQNNSLTLVKQSNKFIKPLSR